IDVLTEQSVPLGACLLFLSSTNKELAMPSFPWVRLLRRPATKSKRGNQPTKQFRKGFVFPRVEALEDRTLLSAPTHIVFGQQPTDTVAGSIINPPVSVLLEDQFNNVVSTATQNVSLAIQNNPGSGTLSGTTSQAANAGVATFDDLSIDQSGNNYTLAATASLPLGSGGAQAIDRSDSRSLAPPLGLTFLKSDGTTNRIEIEALSYQWGGMGGGSAGVPSLQDVQVVVGDPGSAEPEIWGVLASGATFSQVTLHVRKPGINPFEYLTYKLFNVQVSSYQTALQSGHANDSISLHFTRIEEDYTPLQDDGSPGTPVVVSYDVARHTGGAQAIDRSDSRSLAPPLGLTFLKSDGTTNRIEIEALSYQWGGMGGGSAGVPSLQDVQVVVGDPGSAEPEIWGVLASGATFSQVTLHVRKPGINPFEYLTYKLFNVQVSSYQTALQSGHANDSISLHFTRIEEDYTPLQDDGSPGTPVVVSYDVARHTGGAQAIDRSDSRSLAPPLGLTFLKSDGTTNRIEIEALSYQWGGMGGGSAGVPSLQDFQVVVGDPGSAEPEIWGVLASGATFSQVTLHVRKPGINPFEYLTYKLFNVQVSSYQTALQSGHANDSISL